ncbi:LOW QUALITY PROTEIN: carbonic anhydrase 6 [Mus caroli]|uniref:Carbonic anhydrase 6 n=1 Tax=Mus caroli TaxID=10089 RepID=A0A6P5PFF7_MUSCR|nr:LOW QUALITY PROTEIN: carbonic anhydrase 6 [Mus caroli]
MRALVSVVSLFFLGIQAHSEWSYSGDDGVAESQWSEKYPSCGGERQSPIDVKTEEVKFNPTLKPLRMVNYEEENLEFTMTNNGHTVSIDLPPFMHIETSDGTVFNSKAFHFHWGGQDSELSGSEHTIDGTRSIMEAHFVHFNNDYGTYENAKDQKNGLAVVALLFKIDEYAENTYYSDIISALKNIEKPGETTPLKDTTIKNLLPKDVRYYYTYQGSLTTPPCTENVQWFVLRDKVTLSKAQVLTIENSVMDHNNNTIQNGYRSTQPINRRVVEANFPNFPDMFFSNRFYLKNLQKEFLQSRKQKKTKKSNRHFLSRK